ncbi:hypothetical protein ACET3Z_023752 [Daucus carota]
MTPVEMFVRLKIDLIVRINIPVPRVPVSDILVHKDEPVFQVFKLMRQEGFGRLTVVESNGKRDKTIFNSARGAVKPSSLCRLPGHNFTKEAPHKKALLNLMQDKVSGY